MGLKVFGGISGKARALLSVNPKGEVRILGDEAAVRAPSGAMPYETILQVSRNAGPLEGRQIDADMIRAIQYAAAQAIEEAK